MLIRQHKSFESFGLVWRYTLQPSSTIRSMANCFHHQKHGKKIASGDVKKL